MKQGDNFVVVDRQPNGEIIIALATISEVTRVKHTDAAETERMANKEIRARMQTHRAPIFTPALMFAGDDAGSCRIYKGMQEVVVGIHVEVGGLVR